MTHDIIIFTDGSSSGNPGPGGWGAIIAIPHTKIKELGGREDHTTNNRMELKAAIEALRYVKDEKANAIIHTDSSYVIQGITKWIHGWQKNNWITSTKTDVVNKDLWQELIALEESRDVDSTTVWQHVSGHSGIPGNERVDEIATAFTYKKEIELFDGSAQKYTVDIFALAPNKEIKATKDKKRSRSTAKAYSYVSVINRAVETHQTWAECEARVKGRKAKFKKVFSKDEELGLIKEWSV